jgi:RNA recognition motif-containing protein
MPAKLFVGNLSFQATEEDLRELFQQAGTVESVRIVTDQFTGRPRGFGFVEMATKEELAKAIEMLNGRLFRDRNLVVDEARPQRAAVRWRGRRRLAPVTKGSPSSIEAPGGAGFPGLFSVILYSSYEQ